MYRLIIILILLFIRCTSYDKKEVSNNGMEIRLNEIYINHYENDSLNSIRGYVLPRMYYLFEYSNFTSDSVEVVLDHYFGEKSKNGPFLSVDFEYNGFKDTLILSDFESINPIIIKPDESGIFSVGVPIDDYLNEEKYHSETASTLMKYIADNGIVIYNSNNLEEHRLVLNSQIIRKSKDFSILFIDTDDTTVE